MSHQPKKASTPERVATTRPTAQKSHLINNTSSDNEDQQNGEFEQ